MKNKANDTSLVKIEVELPEKWVKMISAIQEWKDDPNDLQSFIRAAVKSWLRADIECMDGRPVADEA